MKVNGIEVGQRGFSVEYCASVPRNESGDADLDRAVYFERFFKSHGAAMRYAKKVYPKDVFGCVRIASANFVDKYDDGIVFEWVEDESEEPEFYSGE